MDSLRTLMDSSGDIQFSNYTIQYNLKLDTVQQVNALCIALWLSVVSFGNVYI